MSKEEKQNLMLDFTYNEISSVLLAIRVFGASIEDENNKNLPDDYVETLIKAHNKLATILELREQSDELFDSIATQLQDVSKYGNHIINEHNNNNKTETENK